MEPPSITSNSQHKYKGYIKASHKRIENDAKHESPLLHENNAIIKCIREFGEYFRDSVLTLSCDNKKLVSFSEQAVDRHIQPKKLFLDTQTPHKEMHDYPNINSINESIIPSGYLVLKSAKQEYYQDASDRRRLVLPASGDQFIKLRSNHYFSANIQSHSNDIYQIKNTNFNEKGI